MSSLFKRAGGRMGAALLSLLLAGSLSKRATGAVSRERRARQADEIREVLLRKLIGMGADTRVLVISVDDRDPSAELLKRLRRHCPNCPNLKAQSEFESLHHEAATPEELRASAEKEVILHVDDVRWVGARTAEIRAGYFEGVLASASATYRVRLIRGHWRIIKAFDTVVS